MIQMFHITGYNTYIYSSICIINHILDTKFVHFWDDFYIASFHFVSSTVHGIYLHTPMLPYFDCSLVNAHCILDRNIMKYLIHFWNMHNLVLVNYTSSIWIHTNDYELYVHINDASIYRIPWI